MSNDYKFTLRANGYHLNIRTIDVGVPVASSEAPGPDQVDIEGTILNPNMFNYQMPTQETPDPSWSVSPLSILLPGTDPNDLPPTDDGVPTPISGDFVYDRVPVIDVGQGIYKRLISTYTSLSTLTPTDIVSNVAVDDYTEERIISRECSPSERTSATYSPVSVVSFQSCATFPETDEWYRPAEYGWYLMKTNVDSAMYDNNNENSDWYWQTEKSAYAQGVWRGGVYCRYNPESGGYSPPVPGTFDDTLFEEPGAVLEVPWRLLSSHPLGPPSSYRWYWCRFLKGGPSDFPVGQRLRCTHGTKFANGNPAQSDSLIDFDFNVEQVGDGLYKIGVDGDWDNAPPYPWPAEIPWPEPTGDPGRTGGSIEDFNIFKLYFKIRLEKL
jgi:hypothetical protein